ncbi:MAG TPA: glycoside hydrolase family 88 protein [Verrucomicrobiae bacterium]|jgi:rhamnogalacturonyl hydrolase YesR|nr:glycoside hydrolase family 88 protein [Verrucomicrobiae bacterium]
MKRCVLFLACWAALGAMAQSVALSPADILGVCKKAADWQLQQAPKHPADHWTAGAFYAGLGALAAVADTPKYHDALADIGRKNGWKPASRVFMADDYCVCQMYLDLYLQERDSAMLGPTRERFDFILAHAPTNELAFKSKNSQDRWSWCDALFMGPPAWLRLYLATGDQRYLDYMDKEWRATSDYLYDKEEHLYFRDSTYFNKREANGKKVFWARGNGWVLAGLARVLEVMPPSHPRHAFYQQQYQEMAAKIATLQQPDGLWRASLLDPETYPARETSGSGFYTFALAWGLNRGLLARETFEPVVRRAWQGLLDCVTPEGKLERVQPIGGDPQKFDPTSTELYGVGAFLLAGSEMWRLALSEQPAAAYGMFVPQRLDDFAWENDRIAFRVYGPALERTGEISSGLDVWTKRTRRPVLEKWYYNDHYHSDHGEGLDMYKVGPSRGCGGTGVWRDGHLYVANNFTTYRLVENGPARVCFELSYAPYAAGDAQVTETKRITLEAGSNLNHIENRFAWTGGPEQLEVVVGIVKHTADATVDFGPEHSWMAYWEPVSEKAGAIGCGVVMSAAAEPLPDKEQAFLKAKVQRGGTLEYYAGAGWTRSGDFPDKAAWVKYISSFPAKTAIAPTAAQ